MTIINSNDLDRLRRIRFALFIKILFRLIEREDRLVIGEARYIVSACIRQHQTGKVTKYKNITDAIVLNLRGLIREDTWRSARQYAKAYERKHRNEIQRAAEEATGYYGVDEIGDQDWIEIEMLRPFETVNRSSNVFQEEYQHGQFRRTNQPVAPPPEPEKISSSSSLDVLPAPVLSRPMSKEYISDPVKSSG